MSKMKIGIVGLPNVGKSTLFNALTKLKVATSNYPFTTIDPHIGIVPIPDKKLLNISKLVHSKKVTPTTIKFVDIAGLVKNANKGEGLGNQFLSHIRDVDAILHIIRKFEGNNISHIYNSIDPDRDKEIIETELILSDLSLIEKKENAMKKSLKSGDKKFEKELNLIIKIKETLAKAMSIANIKLDDDEKKILYQYNLISMKPALYVYNIDEKLIKTFDDNNDTLFICAKLEEDIVTLNKEEQKEFLESYELKELQLNKIIKKLYDTLDVITFYTTNENELRAWTIKKGKNAQEAAGKVHSDMARGFIKAEVVPYNTLIECGSMTKVRETGKLKIEGKNYIVQDSDVLYFKFRVL